jgi:hypothetical protein
MAGGSGPVSSPRVIGVDGLVAGAGTLAGGEPGKVGNDGWRVAQEASKVQTHTALAIIAVV